MKTYLIDACNYVFKKIINDKIHINSGIQKLLTVLNELSMKTGDKFIAFIDGEEETIFDKAFKGQVMCVFSSKKNTADAMVIEYIKNNPAKNYIVVTDDVELRKKTKILKARLLHCDEFEVICKEIIQVINESGQEFDTSNYIFFKQNPKISNEEIEELLKEFQEDESEKWQN